MEWSIPLNKKLNVIHSVPRNERHGSSCRATGGNHILVRKPKQEGGEKLDQKPSLLRFPWERQGRVNSLGVASLNNFGGLWAGRVVSSCLPHDPAMIKSEKYCLLGLMG